MNHCILDENNNQLSQNKKRTHKVTQARDVQLCLAEFLKSGKFLFYENCPSRIKHRRCYWNLYIFDHHRPSCRNTHKNI